MLIILSNFAPSNIINSLNYSKMRRIKKNFQNLLKVANSICDVPYSSGQFIIDFADKDFHMVKLFSPRRFSIGSSILNEIPSNFTFRVTYDSLGLVLVIWYE